jgi:hypothetical protein
VILPRTNRYFELISRRQEGNPLDLNNLPEEYGKQAHVESSTTTAASSAADATSKKTLLDLFIH